MVAGAVILSTPSQRKSLSIVTKPIYEFLQGCRDGGFRLYADPILFAQLCDCVST